MRTRKLEVHEVLWKVEAFPEYVPVRGNAMASGDDEFDTEVEDDILSQLDDGNEWAWATVKVTGSYFGMESHQFLGCCSYRSEADFKSCGYYTDMQSEVLADLQCAIDSLVVQFAKEEV